MAEVAQSSGLLDLEKELTCSVCMQILHQPLTLLDCLHTFCGYCLKEWFAMQASRASSSNPNPFSCVSCRAPVRDTRPDAKVTTLLDMYIKANPGRARDDEEREEINSRYKPGENVLPKIRRERESSEQVEDRRMVEEVMEMSLREVGIGGEGSRDSGVRHRVRDVSRDGRHEDSRRRRRNREAGSSSGGTGVGEESARPSTAADAVDQARQVGHQSSLRSLLSTSDLDSSEMEEEILRQIIDEGILDGIDLNSIDAGQEDELSEKIAEAYRRRHGRMSRGQNSRTEQQRASSPRDERSTSNEPRQQRRPGRSPNPADHTAHSSHPPVSRPHLLEAYPTGQGHSRRTSSETRQTRRQTSPTPSSTSSRTASETQRQATRSATDLSSRPQNSNPASRSATDLSTRPQSSQNQRVRPRDIASGVRRTTDPMSTTVSAPRISVSDGTSQNRLQASRQTEAPRLGARVPSEPQGATTVSVSQPSADLLAPSAAQATYPEPSISCERCGRTNLEYNLHMNCSQCIEGRYNLCLRCWRLGRGCLHWYGFGHKAIIQWEKKAASGAGYPPEHPLPHRHTGHRYLSPPSGSIQHRNGGEQRLLTTSEPSRRLQSGPFCSNCATFTPSCFWECEVCNDGEWGYCNPCVNQGKCCTHPLLPASYPLSTNPTDSRSSHTTQRVSSTTFTPIMTSHSQSTEEPVNESRIPLTFSTKCDICTYPIPPSTTRFHCPQCNDGDFDICTACYLRLAKMGRISAEDGPKGWRRCPNGHRMIVIGFEDSAQGQRRVVVEDLVGGHALDNSTDSQDKVWRWGDPAQQTQAETMTSAGNNGRSVGGSSIPHPNNNLAGGKYPPSGGVGMRALAYWSYWPQEGVDDELAFPKNAEIRECEDINGDWYLGVYCGRKGVFPGNYCRILESTGR